MKAKQDFVVFVNQKGDLVPHYSGESMDGKTKISVKKGDEVPDALVGDLLRQLPDYLQVTYDKGNFVLSDDEKKRFRFAPGEKAKPVVSKRKYTQDSLTVILNEKGVDELKKIANDEFNMGVKTASKSLLTKILQKQEEMHRGG